MCSSGKNQHVGFFLIDKSPKLFMFVSNYEYTCIYCSILNEEVDIHSSVKIESLAMKILLDSEEVCVKLEISLTKRIISSICLSGKNF